MVIHPTSLLEGEVELEEGVQIGAYCVISGKVRIGRGTKIGNRITIKGKVTVGEDCTIYDGAIIGEDPQHLKYKGEGCEVIIGNNVIIREYVTIHRGTEFDKGKTVIGDECMLMAYSHVAHDCVVGKGVIMANCATLGGHAEVGDYAFIGGLSAVHQWARVGAYAMVGGLTGVSLDSVGLERRGFSKERISAIKRAYKLLFRSNLLKREAIAKLEEEFPDNEDIKMLIDFIQTSKRGVARDARG